MTGVDPAKHHISKENGKSFEGTRTELLNKIQNEEQKLSDTTAKWTETQEQLKEVEKKLEDSLKENAQLLSDSQKSADEVCESLKKRFDMDLKK